MASLSERHVVTAVLVAHDGARWLPDTLKALLTQTRPVQRLVAVDTGSADRGPAVLAEVLGQGNVLRLPADTPYASAIAEGLRHPAAQMPVNIPDPVEWIWLIHDDSAPSPRALELLLAQVAADPSVGIAGPKLRDWDDRRLLLEIGVAIDGQGRRETGVERGEFDQGQHDGLKDVLAVSTAGMLVRRDVWTQLGGLEARFGLFRDDIDLGWRVHAAGHRVLAVSDAIVYHAEASARGQRETGVRPRRLDRRNAMLVLLANQPLRPMLWTFLRLMAGSLIRMFGFLVGKKPLALRDELNAVRDLLTDPLLLRSLRAARAHNRSRVYRVIRRFQPHWVTLRRLAERFGALIAPTEYGGEEEEENPQDDQGLGVIRRIVSHPSVVVLLTLMFVTFLAERSLIATAGRLGGGALVPAWGSASEVWASYTAGWHQVGLGSADAAPPYLAILAGLSVITFGKPWLALMCLLVGCVPLSGLTAYLAAKRLIPAGLPVGRRAARLLGRRRVPASAIRAWVAVAYALLPVVSGAVAAGRYGTCVVAVLLPLIGLFGARVLRQPAGRVDARQARRAAWGLAVMVTVATAFVPLTWVLVTGLGVTAFYAMRTARGSDLLIVVLVPPLLLLPTTIGLVLHPSRLLLEAGLHRADLVDARLSGLSILTLDPGGPGTNLGWATAGLLALAVAALPLRSRRTAVMSGWMLILFGFLTAVIVSAITVTEAGESAPGWPGVPLAIAAGGLILTAGAGLQRAVEVISGRDWIYRVGGICAVFIALSTPVLASVYWIGSGVDGPVGKIRTEALPTFLAATNDIARARTLVLSPRPDGLVSYTVLRGTSPGLGDEDFHPGEAATRRLDGLVAGMAIGRGSGGLTGMGIQYVYLRTSGSGGTARQTALADTLDADPALIRLSRTKGYAIWRMSLPGARLMLRTGNELTPLSSDGMTADVPIPAGPAGRVVLLAEPAGGWTAALDGSALKASTVDGWAPSWEVPAEGGRFTLDRPHRLWTAWISVQGVAFFLVLVLALPGGELPAAVVTPRPRGRRHKPAEPSAAEPKSPVGADA
ncbi:glycosyltransferase family 2 protein [Actinocorallia longicatena]|uniref:Glycosyltransferase n=1 Tax=Actinocorallia longicatena TaxID=111803 RepID=A0ABP6QME4_9ACTN